MSTELLVTSSMVHVLGREVTTSSRQVAEFFGKRHDNVLQAIRNLGCSEKFRLLNFKDTDFIDKNGGMQPSFEITRSGFALLGMGFTGVKADVFKEAYIDAFESMETALLRQSVTDAIMGKVSERGALGVYVRQGLNQEQWSEVNSRMLDIAGGCDEFYNAIHSHFTRYFKGGEVPYDLALSYLGRVAAAYRTGYEPEYRGGKLVIDSDLV